MVLFVIASLLPAILIAAGAILGGIWPPVALLGGVPLALLLDGAGLRAPAERAAPHLVKGLTLGLGLLHLALVPVSVIGITTLLPGQPLAAAALFLAAGTYFGQVANANAHELVHMGSRRARRLGASVYSALLFGHHDSAHRLVHHVYVASDRDPNSARTGESFYAFWPRAWIGSFLEGLRAVNRQRAKAATPQRLGTHPYIGYGLISLVILTLSALFAGWTGIAVWVVLCLFAQAQLLLADYVQHYGLRRAVLADGSLEPVSERHSWNAPQVYTAAMMLNAPRHSDHHMHPGRSFPELRLNRDTMPVLPASLPAMAFVALLPPIWRQQMDPLVEDWHSSASARRTDPDAALTRARQAAQRHGAPRRDLPHSVHASSLSDSPHPAEHPPRDGGDTVS
ncbi:MAG: alkane 1-monooxygenase [Paracoccaceae bacterium]